MRLKCGDGIEGLQSLDQGSVDLVFADLPSGLTRARLDVPFDLDALWGAVHRATHERAAVVLMASNMTYAAQVVASNFREFRYDLVWRKNKSSGHLNANRQPLRAHEFLLVFYRRVPQYHPQMSSGHPPVNAFYTRSGGSNYGKALRVRGGGGSTQRYPTSVLDFAVVNNSDPSRIHPQQKPEALVEWVIASYSSPGDLVVDPCAGSATVGVVADRMARRFLGWEMDPERHQAALERLGGT